MGYIESVIIQNINEMVQFIYSNGNVVTLYRWQVILSVCISVALWLAVYILMGIGLRKMAIDRNIEKSYFAFIPFLRFNLFGKLAGETRLLNFKIKNMGSFAAVLKAVALLFMGFILFVDYFPYAEVILKGGAVGFYFDASGNLIEGALSVTYAWAEAINVIYRIIDVLYFFVDLLVLIATVTLYIDLFRQYCPARYVAYTLLSFFLPIDGIFVFAVRNNTPVNYQDYLRSRFANMQGNQYNRPPQDNPFNEYSATGEKQSSDNNEPFSEFFDDDKK